MSIGPRKLLLTHRRSPGDVIVMTALVRDLALAHPGQFEVAVSTSCMSLWDNNPYIISAKGRQKEFKQFRMDYGRGIAEAKSSHIHFLTAFHDNFRRQVGVNVPVLYPTPDLHLSEAERTRPLVEGRYWVILAGGKLDFTTKHYVYRRHQDVVNILRGLGLRFVQAGARDKNPGHYHPDLDGVLNLVGRTNLREFINLIYHADGVVCTITAAMHIAAALGKPCVVTAGGREEWWWEAYHRNNPGLPGAERLPVSHRYLHTQDLLDCCRGRGCWKSKVVPEYDARGKVKDTSLCRLPVAAEGGQRVPQCLHMIRTEDVVAAVLSYYYDGTLQPPERSPMIPAVNTPTTVVLPDGRKASVSVTVEVPGQTQTTALPVLAPSASESPRLLAEPRGNVAFSPSPPRPAPGLPQAQTVPASDVLDHSIIGGRFTVCALLYGDYPELHRQCLDAILTTCPPDRIELRVGTNQVCDSTLGYLEEVRAGGRNLIHYFHADNARKYPVMREMFHDSKHPLTTNWVVWFDDDSICDRRRDWLTVLAEQVVRHYPSGHHMFGAHYFYDLTTAQVAWIRQAAWYRGRAHRDRQGREAPNGNKVHFCTGSWWCLSREAILRCDIPDARLQHNGGDVMIGEQLWQHGLKTKHLNGKKDLVNWSSVPRRGLSERHPAR